MFGHGTPTQAAVCTAIYRDMPSFRHVSVMEPTSAREYSLTARMLRISKGIPATRLTSNLRHHSREPWSSEKQVAQRIRPLGGKAINQDQATPVVLRHEDAKAKKQLRRNLSQSGRTLQQPEDQAEHALVKAPLCFFALEV